MPISKMSTSGRKRVPANSLPRVKRTFQASSEVDCRGAPRRRPGGRGRRVPVQGVLLLVALLPRRRPDDEERDRLLSVGGATRLTGPNPVSHPPHEPPFDLQRKGSGGGRSTRETRRPGPRRAVQGATQVAPRTARDISDPSRARAQRRQMSVKAHRTTGAQTTEPEHHSGVNDVRASPIDEGVGVVEEDELSRATRRPRTGASGSPPRSRRTTRSRRRDGQNCGHRAPRGWVDLLPGAPWVHFVEEVYQKVSVREPAENDSACVPKF